MSRRFGFDEIHLFNTHQGNTHNGCDLVVVEVSFTGTEFKRSIGRKIFTLLLVNEALTSGERRGCRSDEHELAPVAVIDTTINICTDHDHRACGSIAERGLVRHPGNPVDNTGLDGIIFVGELHTPHPGGNTEVVEATLSVESLFLSHRSSVGSRDGETGILSSLSIELRCSTFTSIRETFFMIGGVPETEACHQAIGNGEVRNRLRGTGRAFLQKGNCLFQVGADEFYHFVVLRTRVVAGLVLGGLIRNNRHSISGHIVTESVGSRYVVVGKELIHTSHIEVSRCTEGKTLAKVGHEIGVGGGWVNSTHNLVCGKNLLGLEIPYKLTDEVTVVKAYICRTPGVEVVVARISYSHVCRHTIETMHDCALTPVPVLLVGNGKYLVHVGRHSPYKGLGGFGVAVKLLLCRTVGGENLLDTAGGKQRGNHERSSHKCFIYFFHFFSAL